MFNTLVCRVWYDYYTSLCVKSVFIHIDSYLKLGKLIGLPNSSNYNCIYPTIKYKQQPLSSYRLFTSIDYRVT